jgi:hypothetical protein
MHAQEPTIAYLNRSSLVVAMPEHIDRICGHRQSPVAVHASIPACLYEADDSLDAAYVK